MEDDYHVGQIVDALKELGVDDNTLLVFASDNGPQGETAREMGNQGSPDMGNSGPFRGELGEATEGSIRTFCFVRWPGKVKPDTSSYARPWLIASKLSTACWIALTDGRPAGGPVL